MKKTKKSDVSHAKGAGIGKQILFSSIFGTILGAITLFLLILALSGVCMAVKNPHALITPFCFFALYASAFVSGFASVKRNGGSDALACGALCGALLMLLTFVLFTALGALLDAGQSNSLSILWKLLMLPSSVVGAFLGLGQKNKIRKRKF